MNIIRLEFSLVVIGQDCNPTILNPDFLERNRIVLEEWGWKVKGFPITTPPFATVEYDSGVSVIVDANRFQVCDRSSDGDIERSRALDLAKAYISVLPHVRYMAVGINFHNLVEQEGPDKYLMDLFIKPGPWNEKDNRPQAIGLKFVYPIEGCTLTLSLSGGSSIVPSADEKGAEQKRGLLINANFHRDCRIYPSNEEVIAHIGQARGDLERLRLMLAKIITDAGAAPIA